MAGCEGRGVQPATLLLYLAAALLALLTGAAMLSHVLPKSECLLFVRELVVEDEATSLKYGYPGVCLVAAVLPLLVAGGALTLLLLLWRPPRRLRHHPAGTMGLGTMVAVHCATGCLALAAVTLLTAGYSVTCAAMYSVVRKDLHSLIQVDLDTDGDFDVLVGAHFTHHEEGGPPPGQRDEGELQDECDGPCYKVMLKGQIEDTPTDTDNDDRWFNQHNSGRSVQPVDWAGVLKQVENFPINAKFNTELDHAFAISCRSLLTDSLNHYKLMLTNVYDEEFAEDEDLEQKTVTDNRLLELSLGGAWCLSLVWLVLLLVLVVRLRSAKAGAVQRAVRRDYGRKISSTSEVSTTSSFGTSRANKRKQSWNARQKPPSLFKMPFKESSDSLFELGANNEDTVTTTTSTVAGVMFGSGPRATPEAALEGLFRQERVVGDRTRVSEEL